MAIKKIHEEKNGVIGYVITKEEDLEKLPKNGIAITSKAILVNPTIGVKTYIFYDNDTDKNTDGEWIEWKAKYRGLGDNVKDYIKEYHEDLNKIVDVTNPKIDEGYDVTINDSEEGVLNFEVNGRTLQDVCKDKSNFFINRGSYDNGIITLTQNTSDVPFAYLNENFILKENTTYTLILEILENTIEASSNENNTNQVFSIASSGLGYGLWTIEMENTIVVLSKQTGIIRKKFVYRTNNVGANGSIVATGGYVLKHTSNPSGRIKFRLMFLEGDHTNTPIAELPYIEGIQSVGDLVEDESNVNFGKYKVEVKSVGKNLLNVSDLIFGKKIDDNGNVVAGLESQAVTETIKLKPNTQYVYSVENVSGSPNPLNGSRVFLYDSVGNFNRSFWLATRNDKFTIDNKNHFIRIAYSLSGGKADTTLDNLQTAQLEEGTTATPYEPYYEDIKTYYLDKPLRGLPNGVCDTIEKDKVVRRVGKVVLDGTEEWSIQSTNTNENGLVNFALNRYFKRKHGQDDTLCDRFPIGGMITIETRESYLFGEQTLYIRKSISSNITTVSDLKDWLQANPTTVYYELAEPTEEQLPTVPMINSYNDVTHIYSTNYIQPFIEIFDTVSIFKDANQYLNIECDRVFALPNMDDLEDNAVKEIHMYIYMKEEATLTFPSDIKWETLSEFGKGDYVEIILTYVKTNGVGQWLGSAIVYNG